MKGSNLLYGVLLIILAYVFTVPSIKIQLPYIGSVDVPNLLYGLGQMTLFRIPCWVLVGLLGVVCIATAFRDSSSTQQVVIHEGHEGR
jgi:uncharacterized membrane protein YuzA (DUF378 family)